MCDLRSRQLLLIEPMRIMPGCCAPAAFLCQRASLQLRSWAAGPTLARREPRRPARKEAAAAATQATQDLPLWDVRYFYT